MGLEQAVIALSFVFLVGWAFAWHWARSIQNDLIGRPGYELVRIIALIIGWSLAFRLVGTVVTVVIGLDHTRFDSLLIITLVLQVLTAGVFIWAALRIRALQKDDSDLDASSSESSGEDLERVGVQIDEVRSDSTVAVDDTNSYASA